MKKIIHKWFWAWDFEKEEKWFNELAAKGLHLNGVGFCRYTFEDGTPGEYVYRLEMLPSWPSHAESVQYIRFLEETGAEHVGSLMRWVYFRKKVGENGGFDLFSDIGSRITHLNRILSLVGILLGVNLFNSANNLHLWLYSCTGGNLVASILCFATSFLLGYGFFRLFSKKRELEREKVLHE